jgi:hypothetical protein
MNERIRELAEQTGFRYDNGEWQFGDDSDVQKFAELIVQECVKTGKELYDECEPWGGIEGLYEHFGIKE